MVGFFTYLKTRVRERVEDDDGILVVPEHVEGPRAPERAVIVVLVGTVPWDAVGMVPTRALEDVLRFFLFVCQLTFANIREFLCEYKVNWFVYLSLGV